MTFVKIIPKETSIQSLHFNLLSAIAPRPIALASTIDLEGNVNLSPFSFFNVFGANPPTVVFSPARRVSNNTNKHTLENVEEVGEVVINIVNYAIVEQMSLSSTEYDKGIDEFKKSGLTPLASDLIKPPRVLESPVSLECKVKQIIKTGEEGGAGNLIICDVLLMHIDKNYLNVNGDLDTTKLDLVARMGGSWYCRANGDALFEIPKPLRSKGIGVDALPFHVVNSKVLSGNNLGRLGNLKKMPSEEEVEDMMTSEIYKSIVNRSEDLKSEVHTIAKKMIEEGDADGALKLLMALEN